MTIRFIIDGKLVFVSANATIVPQQGTIVRIYGYLGAYTVEDVVHSYIPDLASASRQVDLDRVQITLVPVLEGGKHV